MTTHIEVLDHTDMNIQLHDRRHVVQIPTIGPREPRSTADLSVSAMLDARNDDTFSMVGGRPSRPRRVDKYPWIRASLSFAGITVERHEELAEKLGRIAAAEVLLLVISYKCDGSRTKWKKAKDLGIPVAKQALEQFERLAGRLQRGGGPNTGPRGGGC